MHFYAGEDMGEALNTQKHLYDLLKDFDTAMLVTTGLWDSQVQYYEPAKWVAKLRRYNTGSQPVLMHVNLEAGHGGKSGRYEHMREIAREYGFVIALAENKHALEPRVDSPPDAPGSAS